MPNSRSTNKTQPGKSAAYPFTAIVGQEEMKLALVLNAVDPLLGGVLIMGHRGTGKSTAVRSLAELLPEISVVVGCAYRCDPDDEAQLCAECRQKHDANKKLKATRAKVQVVDLPLGATEDRVCGTIDIERALTKGKRSFEPGLLARANRGFLYIDEVNLLDDHLVDLLLDVAVTGINLVERESISVEHPARFVLVGSGNPEEGELRPQLLDRFALHVEVTTENDLEQRVEIVERHDAFERNRESFVRRFAKEQEKLRESIERGRTLFPVVTVGRELLKKIAALSQELNLDGHRGELTLTRAARASAALENRRKVTSTDVERVALMSLRHRLRRQPFDEGGGNTRVEQAMKKVFSDQSSASSKDTRVASADGSNDSRPESTSAQRDSANESALDVEFEGERRVSKSRSISRRKPVMKSDAQSQRGRYSKATTNREQNYRIAVDATIRAIAANGVRQGPGVDLTELRYKQFKRRAGTLYIFVIDTSGSMAMRRIERARNIAMTVLRRSYLHRDSVAMVVFRGALAEEVLPPSRSILRAKRALDSLSMGGGTPLSAGVVCAVELAKRAGDVHGQPTILLFTDGGANVPLTNLEKADRSRRKKLIADELKRIGSELRRLKVSAFVIGTRNRYVHDDARTVAEQLGAQYFSS